MSLFPSEKPPAYQVLARKYRPQFFKDVIGQDVFVRMIQNGLREQCMAHGFLLTGMRGIGKTTLARLLAKALCCQELAKSPPPSPSEWIEPCGYCASCVSLQEERHLDVLELDAASHTGIDDMRVVLESSTYGSVMGNYRIYIIDEVHMLSKSAFNALLKTLEEPSAHVKFILATTELSKVPLTVVSRCQQIALRPLSQHAILSLLQGVCAKESVSYEAGALELLVPYAEGGGRDALSLLERTILSAMERGHLTVSDVRSVLGLSSLDNVGDILEHLLKHDIAYGLTLARALCAQGIEPRMVLLGLLEILHQMTLQYVESSKTESSKTLKGESSAWEISKGLLPLTDISHTARLWQMIHLGLQELTAAPFPILALEMVLVRVGYMGQFPTPAEVLRAWNQETHASPFPQQPSSKPPLNVSATLSSGPESTPREILQNHPLVQKAQALFPHAILEEIVEDEMG